MLAVSSPFSVVMCRRDASTAAFTMSTTPSSSALTTVQSFSLSSSLITWVSRCLLTSLYRTETPPSCLRTLSLLVQLHPLYVMAIKKGSIKDNTHERRGHNIHPIVCFTAETEFSGKKEEFLSRDVNKQRLIQMIRDELRERDCTVVNALGTRRC